MYALNMNYNISAYVAFIALAYSHFATLLYFINCHWYNCILQKSFSSLCRNMIFPISIIKYYILSSQQIIIICKTCFLLIRAVLIDYKWWYSMQLYRMILDIHICQFLADIDIFIYILYIYILFLAVFLFLRFWNFVLFLASKCIHSIKKMFHDGKIHTIHVLPFWY